jgi:hypothetical protein
MRVGVKWFKVIKKPDAYGHVNTILEAWNESALRLDYVAKGYADFIENVPKYDSFIVIPENDSSKYQQIINGCYNLYSKIDHEPMEGDWPNIRNFLTHIFDQGDEKQLDVALDWLYLSFFEPLQKLPIICLVSSEKNTGKTMFLKLLCLLGQQNAVILGNEEIQDKFNDDYITKNYIGIDEGLIDKGPVIEKIKSWATKEKAQMNAKGLSRMQVDLFAKIAFTSNNEENFIRIDRDEKRFWIRKVRKYKGPEIPNLLDLMEDEMPYFIHYLKHKHTLKYTNVGRAFFAPKVYHTAALERLTAQSMSQVAKALQIIISERFEEYNRNQDQVNKFVNLYYTISEIHVKIYKNSPIDMQYIKNVLKDDFDLEQPTKPKSRSNPIEDPTQSGELPYYTPGKAKAGRYYEFHIEDFLPQETLDALFITKNHLTRDVQREPSKPTENLPF